MTHPNKRKGDAAELAVARYLAEHGWPHAERSRAGWQADKGDIQGVPGCVFEVKNAKEHKLSAWMAETEVEVENARAVTGLLVVKRRMHADPGDWYAITTLRDWCVMAKDAGL